MATAVVKMIATYGVRRVWWMRPNGAGRMPWLAMP